MVFKVIWTGKALESYVGNMNTVLHNASIAALSDKCAEEKNEPLLFWNTYQPPSKLKAK